MVTQIKPVAKATSEEEAGKQLQEKVAAWNAEYQKNAVRNKAIEADLAKYGLKPVKPSRAKAAEIPEGVEESVKEMLIGKTVTAGDFDIWLAKNHEVYTSNDQRKIRLALKAAGVIDDKAKAKGQATFVWLVGEEMAEEAVKP